MIWKRCISEQSTASTALCSRCVRSGVHAPLRLPRVPQQTILQGFEAFLSTKDAARKRLQAYKTEDRLFSLSSTTSQAVRLSTHYFAGSTDVCTLVHSFLRAQRKELEHAQVEILDGGYATNRSSNFLSKVSLLLCLLACLLFLPSFSIIAGAGHCSEGKAINAMSCVC